ncbi:hypothetical protein [Corynebacterium glutamicum]|nr:hypothetical protein [Corynebacterium glutamicum]
MTKLLEHATEGIVGYLEADKSVTNPAHQDAAARKQKVLRF